ncbi:hypothetical protein FB451DRAFT_1166430 [Mycena latifolia]|nr:hypothetical protein FB451DRAFT_1166430 [Mycena latifolia]
MVAYAEIEENSCYIARWRTVRQPLNALCELFVERNGRDTRASVSCMERGKKRTQVQTSKNKLVYPFSRFSMLRAPFEYEPEGYVRLELRRFRGEVEVEKSDAVSDEFIVDLIDDPDEGHRPYITVEFRLQTFPKCKPGTDSPSPKRPRREQDSADEYETEHPEPSGNPSKRPRRDTSPSPKSYSESESDTEALVQELKAVENEMKRVKASLKAKLKQGEVGLPKVVWLGTMCGKVYNEERNESGMVDVCG